MAGEDANQSPELHHCNQTNLYIIICFAGILFCACVLLLFYVVKLIKRQNRYKAVPTNEDETERYKEMYEVERKEKEDALQRLSKLISDRLTDGNPNIANMNDDKRPTKLAEDMSELYDNEWTAAFEEIDEEGDKDKIEILLRILQISFKWCRLHASEQLKKLQRLFLYPGDTTADTTVEAKINQDVLKSVKDSRKLLAGTTAAYVSDKVLDAVTEDVKKSQCAAALSKKAVESYCRKCAQLCWFLAVQDPPMDIKFTDVRAEDVRAYTMDGNEMDYLVWPPLYLKENGSLMSKGIAQFRMK